MKAWRPIGDCDRAVVVSVAERLDPIVFDPRIPWPTPKLRSLRDRLRRRALREAIRIIRIARAC